MKNKKVILFALIITGIISVLFVGYNIYDKNYVSSDFKHTLIAAVTPTATEDEVKLYIRDARVQVRTKKDSDVLNKLETSIIDIKVARDKKMEIMKTAVKALEIRKFSLDRYSSFLNLCNENNLSCSFVEAKKMIADNKKQFDEFNQAANEADKHAEEKLDIAKNLYNTVRIDLGLPIIEIVHEYNFYK